MKDKIKTYDSILVRKLFSNGATDTKITLNDLEKLAIALKVEALDLVTKKGNN